MAEKDELEEMAEELSSEEKKRVSEIPKGIKRLHGQQATKMAREISEVRDIPSDDESYVQPIKEPPREEFEIPSETKQREIQFDETPNKSDQAYVPVKRDEMEFEEQYRKHREAGEKYAKEHLDVEEKSNLEKQLEGTERAYREALELGDTEKAENLRKSRDGVLKKLNREQGVVSRVRESLAERQGSEYRTKQQELKKSELDVSLAKKKTDLNIERARIDKLNMEYERNRLVLEQKKREMSQQQSGYSMLGSGLGNKPIPSVFGKTNEQKFIKEKVITFVRGKPVVTERWVPVKDQQSRRGIPQDRAELYRSELNQERVFEPTPPFGGNQPQVSQSVPFTGNFGIMQQQQQVPIVRGRPMAKQKPQPAPFSQPMGIIQRQPRPTRVVGGRRPQARSDGRNVIININQTPFGATKVMPRGNVQVRRPVPKQEAKPQKQAPMPFGGFALTKKDKKFRII